jgi:hypothetical protein
MRAGATGPASLTNVEGDLWLMYNLRVGQEGHMTPRAHECLENARTCDSLATQAKDPLVKAALKEAARPMAGAG